MSVPTPMLCKLRQRGVSVPPDSVEYTRNLGKATHITAVFKGAKQGALVGLEQPWSMTVRVNGPAISAG